MIRLFERVKKIDKKTLIKLSCIKTLTSVLFLSGTALYNHYNEVKYEDYYKGEYIKSISAHLSADDFVYIDIDNYNENINGYNIGIVYNSNNEDNYNKLNTFINSDNKNPIIYDIDTLYSYNNSIYTDVKNIFDYMNKNDSNVIFYGSKDNIEKLQKEFTDNDDIYTYNIIDISYKDDTNTDSKCIIDDEKVYVSEYYFR